MSLATHTPIQLALTDVPRSDPLANLRHEYKFEFRHSDVRKIETILEVNNEPIFHAGRESLVSSIYFDSPSLTSFHENLSGIARRFKLRLRWYDSSFPKTDFFFEVKRRINRATSKERYRISSSRPLHEMTLGEIVKKLLQVLPENPQHLLSLRPEPIVLIRYKRRHFDSRDSRLQIRLTLDRDIVAVNQIGAGRLRRSMPVSLDGRVILEVKSTSDQKKYIPQLLLPLRPRLARFSKYVVSCANLGLICGIDAPFISQI
jgi:SPX domain protein involved in polyphosphate accumulation